MIYVKVLFPPLSKQLLAEVNEFIDYIEDNHCQVTWSPDKTTIKIKVVDETFIQSIKTYLKAIASTYRIHIYNEEEKTETLISVMNDTTEGEYRLPLFPEDYKF